MMQGVMECSKSYIHTGGKSFSMDLVCPPSVVPETSKRQVKVYIVSILERLAIVQSFQFLFTNLFQIIKIESIAHEEFHNQTV